ncbi:MAG: hypothetical protein JST80_10870 [Bdellovibrionales bacterium]|nr:hypothetical protein [Bdellovibrionales bacterium]
MLKQQSVDKVNFQIYHSSNGRYYISVTRHNKRFTLSQNFSSLEKAESFLKRFIDRTSSTRKVIKACRDVMPHKYQQEAIDQYLKNTRKF